MPDRPSFWTLPPGSPGRVVPLMGLLAVVGVFAAVMIGSAKAQTAATFADNDRDALARQIRLAVTQLHDLQEQAGQHEQQHAQQRQQLADQIEQLGQDVAKAQADLHQAQQQARDLQRTLDAADTQLDQARLRIATAAGVSLPMVAALQAQRPGAIPSFQPHASLLADLADLLQASDPLTQADALTRWHDWLSQQLRLYRQIELDNRLVELPQAGRAKYAYVLRLGAIGELYLTEDHTAAGVAARQASAMWQTDLDQAARQQVGDIIAIVRQQQPVRIVPVPLMLQPAGGSP